MTQPILADFLFTGATIVTMDPQRRILHDSAVAVQSGRIAWIGPTADAPAQVQAAAALDLRGGVLIPGLVNTHGHWAMTLYRGLVDDCPLEKWLDVIWKVERQFNSPENVTAGTQPGHRGDGPFRHHLRGGYVLAVRQRDQHRAGGRVPHGQRAVFHRNPGV